MASSYSRRAESGERDNLREWHFIERDVEANGAGHEKVVVSADDCAIGSVLLSFVSQELVENLLVPFSVNMIADALDESGDDHRLCGRVGVESIFAREALPDLIFRLAARV